MANRNRDTEADLLAGLVPDDLAQAYGKLSTRVRVSKEQAAEILGGEHLVEELTRRGLARIIAATPDQAATFQPVPELIALQTALVSSRRIC
ncbi:MAG TPA: hypothetical protein VGG16_18280 [Streptosporangiaceae bacterium]|jgi:hypothetical protein